MAKQSFLYNMLFNFQRRIIMVLYGVTSFFVISILVVAAEYYIPIKNIAGLVGLVASLASIVFGVVLYVFSTVPDIYKKYDPIRNKVARRGYLTATEFCVEINNFIIDNFTFAFLPVAHSFIKILRGQPVFSSIEAQNLVDKVLIEKIENLSFKDNSVQYVDEVQSSGKKYHIYLVPIWMEEIYVGYWCIASTLRLPNICLSLLADIEDNLLDDQALNAAENEKALSQKKLYQEVDALSDKISRMLYKSIDEYGQELLEVLVSFTGCSVGMFRTVFSKIAKVAFSQSSTPTPKDCIAQITVCPIPPKPTIINLHNDYSEYVLVVPIMVDALRGVLYLADQDKRKLQYYIYMLGDVENIKLDNDIETLAAFLQLPVIQPLSIASK